MRRASAGYTLVEIMTAVVVMTIGATGILAMQGASVRSNQDASETSTAINWGSTWMERIKRDAQLWTARGNGDSQLDNTQYLKQMTPDAPTWVLPAAAAPESPGADFFGFDTRAVGAIRYCVNVRFTVAHAYNPLTHTTLPSSDADAIRADVRVWWPRNSQDTDRGAWACLDGTLPNAQVISPATRKHYLSSVVSWRMPRWP